MQCIYKYANYSVFTCNVITLQNKHQCEGWFKKINYFSLYIFIVQNWKELKQCTAAKGFGLKKAWTNLLSEKTAVSKVSDWDDDASHSLDSGKPW